MAKIGALVEELFFHRAEIYDIEPCLDIQKIINSSEVFFYFFFSENNNNKDWNSQNANFMIAVLHEDHVPP